MSAESLFAQYGENVAPEGFDEMFHGPDVRGTYKRAYEAFAAMDPEDVRRHAEASASSYLGQGITFGVAGEERPLKEQAQAPSEYARAICDFLHQRLAYLPGSTTVNHTAADSWAAGSGVCQDFAHVSIGLLREAGIPAHRHVVVARGRSYPDCPPLRGIYSSGGQSELFVSVEITRVH